MKKIITLILILIFGDSYGQSPANSSMDYTKNIESYSMSNPDVYNFEKYSLNQSNYYTGKVDVSIPIYTIKTGGIEYPISLGYNTGGIKVDQLASDVGLGWTLNRSVITRTINQANDFDNTGSLELQSDYNTYSNDDKSYDLLYHSRNRNKIGYFLQKQINHQITHDNVIDFLPDTYHFYSNDYSTNFFFNDVNNPIEIDPKGTKIETTIGKVRIDTRKGNFDTSNIWHSGYNLITQDFSSITITTNEGIQYFFSDCDYSYSQPVIIPSILEYDPNSQVPRTANLLDSPAEVSAWHITKIVDLKTGKKIDFIYDITSSNPNHSTPLSPAFNKEVSQRSYGLSMSNSVLVQTDPSSYFYNMGMGVANVSVVKKRLKTIVFDEGEIQFNYNNIGVSGLPTIIRNDIYNADCVTQIYLKDKNLNTVKTYNFNYGYFTSNYNMGEFNPDGYQNTYRYNRLKLLSFGETGKPSYNFLYDETIKLPPVNSFSIDFLGYYNNSIDLPNLVSLEGKFPTMYYYRDQFEKSLLPFPIPNKVVTSVIPGYFNRQANNYAKSWSLTKIELPTNGTKEFIYETNDFEEFGENIIGGGIRIKQQKINDDFGNTRTIDYFYTKDNGKSSGSLSTIPFFGFPTGFIYNTSASNCEISYPLNGQNPATIISPSSGEFVWQIYDRSNLNADITSGSYVGYSKVRESEVGNGSKTYRFTSNEMTGFKNVIYRVPPEFLNPSFSSLYHFDLCYYLRESGDPYNGYITETVPYSSSLANLAIGNSAIFSNIFTDNSYKRGKLLEESIYNESNQLLKQSTINYLENLINTYSYYQGYTYLSDELAPGLPILPVPNNPTSATYVDFRPYLQLYTKGFIAVKKDIKISQFLINSRSTTIYDNGGNSTITENYTFKPNGSLSTSQTNTSDGDTVSNVYFYSQDSTLSNEPQIANLISTNVVGVPLKAEVYRGIEKISEEKIEYAKDATTSNLLLPKHVYAKKGADFTGNNLEKKVTYNSYDIKGNITQYTTEKGIPVSLVWGYGNTMLIAKIENIAYSSIPATLITAAQNASNINNNEANLIVSLNAIRNNAALANAYVTTFTYRPLIGLSSVTDSKGDRMTYSYDSLNRLLWVKDKNGNILSENQYNYKP